MVVEKLMLFLFTVHLFTWIVALRTFRTFFLRLHVFAYFMTLGRRNKFEKKHRQKLWHKSVANLICCSLYILRCETSSEPFVAMKYREGERVGEIATHLLFLLLQIGLLARKFS